MPPSPPKSVLQVLTALGLAAPGCVQTHDTADAPTGRDAADAVTFDVRDTPFGTENPAPVWDAPVDTAGGNIPPDTRFDSVDVPDASDATTEPPDAPDGDEDADAGT